MPSTALKAMRRNIHKGSSRKALLLAVLRNSPRPRAREISMAARVTWLAVTPAAASRPTMGRRRAWKRGFELIDADHLARAGCRRQILPCIRADASALCRSAQMPTDLAEARVVGEQGAVDLDDGYTDGPFPRPARCRRSFRRASAAAS